MNKRGIALFLVFLVFLIPTVDAFSFGDVFDAIGNFFKGIFGKKAVGIQQQCECITDDNCNIGYYCKNESIVCNPPYMFEFNGLCVEVPISQQYTLTADPISGTVPLTVTFTVTLDTGTTNITTYPTGNVVGDTQNQIVYEWHFGDTIETTTTSTIQHTYQNSGGYNTYAVIKQNNQIIATTNNIIITVNQQPHLLTASPQYGVAPLNVRFTATLIYEIEPPVNPNNIIPTANAVANSNIPTNGISYEWIFGDDTSQTTTSNTIDHIYQNVGVYTAYANIKNNNIIISTTNNITINVLEEITNVTGNITIIPESLNFGEVSVGSSSSIDIEIINNGEETWYIEYIDVPDPEITLSNETFTLYPNSIYVLTVTFTPISYGVVEGFFTAYVNPDERLFDYYYSGYGLIVAPIPYTLTANPMSGDAPLTVTFTVSQNSGTPTTNITNFTQLDSTTNQIVYEWNFGDNTTNITTTNTVQYIYTNEGNYQAFVEVMYNNETIDISNPVTINVQVPSGPGTGVGNGGTGNGGGGGGSSGGGGVGCEPQWSCTLWSSCSKETNTQTRTCSDFNNCNTNIGKPSEIQSCTPTLADQLGISSMGENIGGEIQDFISEGGKLKSTYIALILLFILIILCSLLIYFRGPFRKKKIMDNEPLSKFSDEKGKLKDISDLSVFKKIEITDPIIKPAVEAVKKAKSDGFTRKEIEIELRNNGWTEKQIQDILRNVF